MVTTPARFELKETTDYAAMRQLALDSGLEDGNYSDFVKAYGFFEGATLVACAGLKSKRGIFSLECVAVKEGLRGAGLGSRLIGILEEEAMGRGADRVWALARAPGFFEKIGYRRMVDGVPDGPNLVACKACRQFHENCNPSIVLKVF
jgi:N-acetylglutamate synthase-like GNAT family acetyltransferase